VSLPTRVLACALLAFTACGARTIESSGPGADSAPEAGVPDAVAPEAAAPEAAAPVHWVLVGQAANARDIGGTRLADGASVAYGNVLRGGPLAGLDPTGCAEFARLGIRTIVDLRIAAEIQYAPDAACAVNQAPVVYAPMPIPYGVSAAEYIADLDATASVASVFALLANDTALPLYFHCTYGRDRSGVAAAVILLALGATRAAVIDEYQLTTAAGLATSPASLEAVLDEIDRRGGIEAYLASAGVPGATIAAMRARLIAR
jgi:protein-tyrosine phosphatase